MKSRKIDNEKVKSFPHPHTGRQSRVDAIESIRGNVIGSSSNVDTKCDASYLELARINVRHGVWLLAKSNKKKELSTEKHQSSCKLN